MKYRSLLFALALAACGDKDGDSGIVYPDEDGDGYTSDVDCQDDNPDVNPDEGAQARFQEISAAYEVLSDPEKRRIVDMGGDPLASAAGGGAGGFSGFGGLGDVFEAFFGGGTAGRGPVGRVRPGSDSLLRMRLTLDECATGISKQVTVDTAVLGRRERDVRRGYTIPPKVGPGTIVDGVLHPAWTLDFITNPPIVFANVVGLNDEDGSDPVSLAEHMMRQFDQALSWSDVDWLRGIWDGPLVLKGIQRVDDAVRARDAGVDGVALSNHGGRQLDDAPSPVSLIEPVREAVGDGFTIVCDGGVRRGSDIVKALALGADLCSIGRPYLYAMGAAGERGVDHLLGFLQEGLERTMALTGSRRLDEIDRDLVEWV